MTTPSSSQELPPEADVRRRAERWRLAQLIGRLLARHWLRGRRGVVPVRDADTIAGMENAGEPRGRRSASSLPLR